MKIKFLTLLTFFMMPFFVMAQDQDFLVIADIYKNALTSRESYNKNTTPTVGD
jgi:hypothetical protein